MDKFSPLDAETPWYGMLLPRIFGRKVVNEDSGVRVTSYFWRDGIYISKVEVLPPPEFPFS